MDQTCRRSNTSSTDVEEAGISSPRPTSHVVFVPAEDFGCRYALVKDTDTVVSKMAQDYFEQKSEPPYKSGSQAQKDNIIKWGTDSNQRLTRRPSMR
jgi:hypothetical protein